MPYGITKSNENRLVHFCVQTCEINCKHQILLLISEVLVEHILQITYFFWFCYLQNKHHLCYPQSSAISAPAPKNTQLDLVEGQILSSSAATKRNTTPVNPGFQTNKMENFHK